GAQGDRRSGQCRGGERLTRLTRRRRVGGAAQVTGHRLTRILRRFWDLAWDANITGQAAMVAYSMLLAVVPIALLGLFVAGNVLSSEAVQRSMLNDLREIFPGAAVHTLNSLLNEIKDTTTGTGVLALLGSVWLGASF